MKAYLRIGHLLLTLTFLFAGCASKIEKLPQIGIQQVENIYPGSVIKMTVDSRINSESLAFFMNEQKLEYSTGLLQLPESTTIGKQKLIARFTFNNKEEEIPITLSVYAREKPIKIAAEVINTFEHSTDYYTQGLEFEGDWLYESTGGLGNSLIIRYNPFTGVIDQEEKLGKEIFGEGITLVD
ncbi:MAG: glutaminyl-peptide cyclotransferase, partial [Flavobacteriaceae bacterium]